jgi:hypothetical protein
VSSSLTYKGQQYVPLISDLDAVTWSRNAPTQSLHLLGSSLATPLRRN